MVEARGCGPVGEGSVPFVVKEKVGRAVFGVIVRHRIVILAETEIIVVNTTIEIQATIAVIIGCGCARERSLGRLGEFESICLQLKSSVALIQKEQRPTRPYHQKVLTTAIKKVGKQGAGGIVENTDTGLVGDILEGPIAAIAVETIGKPCWLAYVEVIVAIAVKIADRQSVVSINVNTAGGIQLRAPKVGSGKHLLSERRISSKRLQGNVAEKGTG